MSSYVARPYERESDLAALIPFAQELTRARQPRSSYYHPGDFVWQLYAFDTSDDVRLWRRGAGDGAIAACAIFEPPLTFQFGISPTIAEPRDLTAEIIRWVEQRRALVADKEEIPLAYRGLGGGTLSTVAMDSDASRITLLIDSGFTQGPLSGVRFARGLEAPLPAVVLPDGATFRRVSEGDVAARAELHRDAWSVWGPSKHSTERYQRLRSAPLYDPGLDIVLEFEGGMVSYCVCWLDSANQIGYFEPVGTRPSATGRGFGRAVVREGFRRLREKGMTTAAVTTAFVNKPALALYASAGFEQVDSEHTFVKSDPA
ncbi:MAG: GNAT family N-acetyltransferase [Dehalococcoidia bacterium]